MARHRHWQLLPASTITVVATLTLYAVVNISLVEARQSRQRRLSEIQGCQPNAMPYEERCAFVRTHPSCRPEDGWIPYLEVHYCYLSQMEWASTSVFLLWIAILFGLMLMVAERFFCPSLELISEYLKLPPCVAGATLLSFGNGAPDVFTQLAAISQGDTDSSSPGAVAMALSEPLGSGLFVGNIVFGLVVLFSGLSEVRVERSYFLKDCLFYLGGVVIVFAFLIHGVVMVWEVALLAGYYLVFIIVTVLLSRGDEPVHADPRLHEVPHRLRPLDSYLKESFRRIRDFSVASFSSHLSESNMDAEVPLLEGASPNKQRKLQSQLKHQQNQPQNQNQQQKPQLPRGPILERIEEATAAGVPGTEEVDGGGGGVASTSRGDGNEDDDAGDNDDDIDIDLELLARLRDVSTSRHDDGMRSNATSVATAGFGANNTIRINNGVHMVSSISPQSLGYDGGGGNYKPPQLAAMAVAPPPSAWLPSVFTAATGRTLSNDTAEASAPYSPYGAGASFGRGSLDALPSLRRENSGKPPGRMELLWRRLERPGLAFLSLFMPRVAIDTHARYRKTCAVLLPPLFPTLVGWAQGWLDRDHAPEGFWRQTWWLASTGVGLLVAAVALRYYPRKGHLHGYAAGIATVIVFAEAMLLLDASAGELVSAAVALGQIFGISPSLLGATLLAWGNSVSDLVSNITLAKDGLPSMAITACFASPMFVLLAGLVTSLAYATRNGDMQLPHDLALKVLYGCSCSILCMWALVVPFVFRFRLNRRVGLLAVAAYLVYQSLYIWAIVHDSRN